MTSVQIKDVPEATHVVLRQRAARATLEEVLERAGRRSGGSVPFRAAVEQVREDRDRR